MRNGHFPRPGLPAFSLPLLLLSLRCVGAASQPGEVDPSFAVGTGFSHQVETVAVDAEGRILCGGSFGTFQGTPTEYLARLRPDGSLDHEFAQTPRPSARVRFLIPLPDGRLVIGGDFLKVGDVPRQRLAWLLPDGRLDTSVTADVAGGLTALVPSPSDRVLVGGNFTTFGGQPRRYLARLALADGALDPTFVPGSGLSSAPGSPVLLAGDQLLLDANWSEGTPGSRSVYLFRMNPDGQRDPSFVTENSGGPVRRMVLLPDNSSIAVYGLLGSTRLFRDGPVDPDWAGRVPAGRNQRLIGQLRDGRMLYQVQPEAVGTSPGTVYRLFADGSVDESFRVLLEDSADASASCSWEMADGRVLIGGSFASVNGHESGSVVIVYGSSAITPGFVRWHGGVFGVEEKGGVARLPLFREGDLAQPVTVRVSTSPITATAGSDFEPVLADVVFAPGESSRFIDVPLGDDAEAERDEEFEVRLEGEAVAESGGLARVVVLSDEGFYAFNAAGSQASELAGAWEAQLSREGAAPYAVDLEVAPRDGSASTNDLSLQPVQIHFAPGSRLATASVPIFDDAEVEGAEDVTWELGAVPGGSERTEPSQHLLTLLDNDLPEAPGEGLDAAAELQATTGGGVLLSGGFSRVHGQSVSGIARLRASGVLDASFALADLEGACRPLGTMADGRIYGNWLVNTPPLPPHLRTGYLGRLLADGSVDPDFAATNRFQDSIWRHGVVLTDGSLVVDKFKVGPWSAVQEMMKVDAPGAFVPGFASNSFGFTGTSPSVILGTQRSNVFLIGGPVYVPRGAFGSTVSRLRSDLIRLHASGAVDTNFHCTLQGPTTVPIVQAFVVAPDDRVYVQGSFTRVSGAPRPGLARLTRDGWLDPGFEPPSGLVPTAGEPGCLMAAQPDGQLLLALPARTEVIRLRLEGPRDDAFGPVVVAGGAVESLVALDDGRIALSGGFTTVNGNPRWRLAWLDHDGRLLPDRALRLMAAVRPPVPNVEVSAESRVAGQVQVERSETAGPWLPVGTFSVLPGWTTLFAEPAELSARYYRARLLD